MSPKLKSSAPNLPFNELARDRVLDCALDCNGRVGECRGSSSGSGIPSSLERYCGGRVALGVAGAWGLRERGEEKVRIGRGRTGMTKEEEEDELELVEITEAFLERSASVGVAAVDWSGEGWVNWICSIPRQHHLRISLVGRPLGRRRSV